MSGYNPNHNLQDNINTYRPYIQTGFTRTGYRLLSKPSGQYQSTPLSSIIQDLHNVIATILTQATVGLLNGISTHILSHIQQQFYDSDSSSIINHTHMLRDLYQIIIYQPVFLIK